MGASEHIQKTTQYNFWEWIYAHKSNKEILLLGFLKTWKFDQLIN